MLEEVKALLAAFGYTVSAEDEYLIGFIINKVENNITSKCNTTVIPDGLYETAVEQVAGEFLLAKRGIPNGLPGFDITAAVKTVQEGDTSVTFKDDKSPAELFTELITHLLHPVINYGAFRRLRW